MIEDNKPSQTTIEVKTHGPVEVKVIMLHKMESIENRKHYDRVEPRDLNLTNGPFRPIKNIGPPTIVEEYRDENY